MSKQLDIVSIGSIVVDYIRTVDKIGGVEEKCYAHSTKKFPGGVTLNHIAWATILGLKTGVFGRIGSDENGNYITNTIDTFGIDRSHLLLDGDASAYSDIYVDREGERCIYMFLGATASITAKDIRKHFAGYIKNAKFVSTEISQLPLEAVLEVMKIAKSAKVPTFLDVDVEPSRAVKTAKLGTQKELNEILDLATFLKPSKNSATELSSEKSPDALAMDLFEKYKNKQLVAITAGREGCVITDGRKVIKTPPYKVKAVDTTGAGDAFFGGMIAGVHYGLPLADIGRLANACGAVCAGIYGAFPQLDKSKKAVFQFYKGDRHLLKIKNQKSKVKKGDTIDSFLNIALSELNSLRSKLSANSFQKAIATILKSESKGGRVHITGIGKPSHVARYASALFSSTGTPAYFLDASETTHGSAGQVKKGDVVIAISNSGSTAELLTALNVVKRNGAVIIGVSGNASSPLAKMSDCFLYAGVKNEGDSLNLPPRTSILAETLVLTTLSAGLQQAKDLDLKQYYKWHQAGAIGKSALKKLK